MHERYRQDGWEIAYAERNIDTFRNKIKVRNAYLLVALHTVFDLSDLRNRQEY